MRPLPGRASVGSQVEGIMALFLFLFSGGVKKDEEKKEGRKGSNKSQTRKRDSPFAPVFEGS
jgi:hypothetical protein